MKVSKYEQDILDSSDLAFLKAELLKFRATNNRLNKRNQKLESQVADFKYFEKQDRETIDRLEKALQEYVYDNGRLNLKLSNIPEWVRSCFCAL